MSSHHRILGVPPNATLLQIKRAYFKKAKVLHPDVNKSPNAEAEFVRVNMAYEALTNPKYIHPPVFRKKRKEKTKAEIKREWLRKRNEELRKRAIKIANAKRRQRAYESNKYAKGNAKPTYTLIIAITFLIPSGISIISNFHPNAEKPNVAAILIGSIVLLLGVFLLIIALRFLFSSLFK